MTIDYDDTNGEDPTDLYVADGSEGLVYRSRLRTQDFTPVTDKKNPKVFWIIFNPHYPAPPKVRFSTQGAAEAVAERMALRFGQEFYVMRAVTRYTRPEKAKKKELR